MKNNSTSFYRMLLLFLFMACALSGYAQPVNSDRVHQVFVERQPIADLGNGFYRNPILAGDYGDPTVVRVGVDYYMTHTCYQSNPALLVWHSRDLVNWQPIGHALRNFDGNIWAPDIVHFNNLYYIYFPAKVNEKNGTTRRSNFVITARNPGGPWSRPIDLKVGHIDPGHAVDSNGNRYLFLSDGYMIRLSDDGLHTEGKLRKVYEGWNYPAEWAVECKCVEGPKICQRNGYYYLTFSQGGTAGPPTSHMAVVARSRSIEGPWKQSPFNPLIHTYSREERWWSQGHGTLIEAADGSWWIMYHGICNGYRTLGRQTLLLPLGWTEDGWPKIKAGIAATDIIQKPAGENVGHGLPLSDNFTGANLGLQWTLPGATASLNSVQVGNGELLLRARGESVAEAAMLLCSPVNMSYEVQVEVEISKTAQAGIMLFYNSEHYQGVAIEHGLVRTIRGSNFYDQVNYPKHRVFFKILNIKQDVSFFFSKDGITWCKFNKSVDVSGYHRNVLKSFRSLRIALYAKGEGQAIFRNFKYTGLD